MNEEYMDYNVRLNFWNKMTLAQDLKCPIDIQEELSNDNYFWVRRSLLFNEDCPTELKQAIYSLNFIKR